MKNKSSQAVSEILHTINDTQKNLTSAPYILCSNSDVGVQLNSGRNGTRFGPKSIIAALKKLNNSHKLAEKIYEFYVSDHESEKNDFEQAQEIESKKIEDIIRNNKGHKIIHLGGGHDHAFPLLKAITNSNRFKRIYILNIDAHLDTRVEEIKNSGTPFRDFDNFVSSKNQTQLEITYHLCQYGTHIYSNSTKTMSALKAGEHSLYYFDELLKMTNDFHSLPNNILDASEFKIDEETAVFISLDCDAIEGSTMKAVSAVNPRGIPIEHIYKLLKQAKQINSGSTFFGIYEYNPIFDDLSSLGAKTIASMIYKFLEIEK